jgi:ABC-type spermidine/putrescine transport system permease subunit II
VSYLERRDDGTIVFAGTSVPAVYDTGLALIKQQEAMERKARQDRILYARWVERHEEQARRDRKTRSILIGAGAVFALTVLGLLAFILWWVANIAQSLGMALLVIPGAFVGISLLGLVGHSCVTTVTHRH